MWEIGLGTKMFRWRRLLEILEHDTCVRLKVNEAVKNTEVSSLTILSVNLTSRGDFKNIFGQKCIILNDFVEKIQF